LWGLGRRMAEQQKKKESAHRASHVEVSVDG
jgi:hypothetical protein